MGTALAHSCVSVCGLHRSCLPSRQWESRVISGDASRPMQRLFTAKASGVSDRATVNFPVVVSGMQSERRKLLLGDSYIGGRQCTLIVGKTLNPSWKSRGSLGGNTVGGNQADSSSQINWPGPAPENGLRSSVSTSSNAQLPQRITQFADTFWRFVRPHTIRGTFIGATALVVRALIENPALIDWSLLPKALQGLLALLCGNGYIVGINQIYDVGIDKVNKPFLPIAAGDLSIPAAWVLVLGLAIVGISIVTTNFGPLITCLYSFGLFLGGIYSVPPLRLKQYAFPAFLIIATVRGFLLNFGVYYATRAALGLHFIWNPSIVFITGFVTVFATVIAITKDLPDIEGDKKYKISTFATKLGVRKISFLGAGLLLLNYIGAIFAGLHLRGAFRTQVMVPAHAILGISLVYQTWLLDAEKYSKDAIAGFYRFVWYLFYLEYILLPFM